MSVVKLAGNVVLAVNDMLPVKSIRIYSPQLAHVRSEHNLALTIESFSPA